MMPDALAMASAFDAAEEFADAKAVESSRNSTEQGVRRWWETVAERHELQARSLRDLSIGEPLEPIAKVS